MGRVAAINRDNDKYIREHWFKDHVAQYEKYGHTEMLTWRKPGTSIYLVRYLCEHGTLCVYGDLGSAVYCWHYSIGSMRSLANCSLDYFESKCEASEEGRRFVTWSGEQALKRVEEIIREHAEQDEEISPDDLWNQFNQEGHYGALHSRQEWTEWLNDNGSVATQYLGYDWWEFAYTVGDEIAIRCQAHLIGLKMAFEQLEKREAM